MMLKLLISSALIIGCSFAQDIQCFIPGNCADSTEVGISFPTDSNACLQDCKDNLSCFYFSYEFEDDICVQFSECDHLVNTNLNQSTSGHYSCDSIVCSEIGQCDGTLLDYGTTSSEDDCLDFCVDSSACTWYSFNSAQGVCSVFSDCERVDTSVTDLFYGQRECREGAPATGSPGETTTPIPPERRPTLLVAGDNLNEIDVIDLDGRTCDSIPDVPSLHDLYYGFVKDQGATPVLCKYDICYELNGNTWEQNLDVPLSHAYGVGVQFDDDTYWITGGNAPNDYTHIWNSASDSFSSGPDLPVNLAEHCTVALNSTHAYIAGDHGDGSGVTAAYVFDSTTQAYTALPSAIYRHHRPACGIAQTAFGPEFIVIGMYDNQYVDVFNIEANTWRNGGTFPGNALYPGYIQWEDSFLVLDGDSNIYQYDPTTGEFELRAEKTTNSYDFSFLLLIDGTALNCV